MHAYVIDLSWSMYRSYHSFGHFSANVNGMEKPTGHIFGTLSTIEAILKKEPRAFIFLCEDGKPVGKELNPNYKAGRQSLSYNIMQDRDLIEKIALLHPQVAIAYNETAEADQVMYSAARVMAGQGHRVTIFSGDDDMLQALTEDIDICRGTDRQKGEVWITKEDFGTPGNYYHDKYNGCPIDHLPKYRALVGDHSDNLRGIDRIPRDLAIRVAKCIGFRDEAEDRTSLAIVQAVVSQSQKKYITQIMEEYKRIALNYRIMKLTDCKVYQKSWQFNDGLERMRELKLSKWEKFLGGHIHEAL